MKVFCKIIGKNSYPDKADGTINYNALICTSAFNSDDGFAQLECYRCSVDEDLYESLSFLDDCFCDLAFFNKDGRQYVICSDLEKVE